MANPIGPLLPFFPSEEKLKSEEAQAAGKFVALALLVRAAPSTLAAAGRYGLGLRVTPGAVNPVAVGPLTATNLAPFPFGFLPADTFGLKPNYYIPLGLEELLPSFLPGVKEQRAEIAAKKAAADQAAEELRKKNTPLVLANFGNESLERLRQLALSPEGASRFADPAATAAAIAAELERREAERLAYNAAIEARLGKQPTGVKPVSDPVATFLQNAFPNASASTPEPGVGVGGPLGVANEIIVSSANEAHQAGAPVPGAIHTPDVAPGGKDTADSSFRKKKNAINGGPFLDKFFAVFAGDP